MILTTSRVIALGVHAALFFAGSIHAEDANVGENTAAAALTPKEPIKSEGCSLEDPKVPATPGGLSKRLKLGERHLRLFVPKNYKPQTPAPLIIAFHDFNVSAPEFEKVTQLSSSAYNKDAIVVYPEASQDGRWMSDAEPPANVNDIDFTEKLLNRMSSRLCIDTDRIYATGMGTGGGMMHLLACSASLSNRIAAFAGVNVNIFEGFASKAGRADIKDPAKLLWENCRAQRRPVRIMEIHGENNTLFDYWGENKVQGRKRLPVVKWLVDWATHNKCGGALEMPAKWRGEEDSMYKTPLEKGYIFEGFVLQGVVTKATYHCWDEKEAKESPEGVETGGDDTEGEHVSSVDGTEKSAKDEMTKNNDAKDESKTQEDDMDPEEKKRLELEDFTSQLKNSIIQEHYYVRGYAHGWPRVSMLKPKDTEGKISTERINETTWEDISVLEIDHDLSFDNDDVFTFLYGFSSTPAISTSERVEFDSTIRVLDWFRMFRLSDDAPKPPRNAQGLTERESSTLDKLVADIEKAMENHSAEDGERKPPVVQFGDLPPMENLESVEMGDGAAKQPQSREKDEL